MPKLENSNETFWLIFKQCAYRKLPILGMKRFFKTQLGTLKLSIIVAHASFDSSHPLQEFGHIHQITFC